MKFKFYKDGDAVMAVNLDSELDGRYLAYCDDGLIKVNSRFLNTISVANRMECSPLIALLTRWGIGSDGAFK